MIDSLQKSLGLVERPVFWITLFTAGLALRLILIASVTEPIDRDAEQYYILAQHLVEGKGFSLDGENPYARRSPGYPAFLALIIFLFGKSPAAIYVFQAILNLLAIGLTALVLEKMGVRPPVIAAVSVLFMFSTSFIYINVMYAEIMAMCLIAALVWIHVTDRPAWSRIVATALIIATLIYLRPPFLLLPVFLAGAGMLFWLFRDRATAKQAILPALLALVLILPWTLRNHIAFHRFMPLVATGGIEMSIANFGIEERTVWFTVTGIQAHEEERARNDAAHARWVEEFRQTHPFGNLAEFNQALMDEAVRNILRHPFRFMAHCVNRFLLIWYSPPIGETTIKNVSPLLFWGILAVHYLLITAGLTGIVLLLFRSQHRALMIPLLTIVYLCLLHAGTLAIRRYALPMLPVYYVALGWFVDRYMYARV